MVSTSSVQAQSTVTPGSQTTFVEQNALTSNWKDWKEYVVDSAIFAWEYLRSSQARQALGTPLLCSPAVARELSSYMIPSDDDQTSRYFVEAGAGTGAITKFLIRQLRPQDQLHVVEMQKRLYDRLVEKYGKLTNVFIHHAPLQEWKAPEGMKFNAVISTIPLNNLPSTTVKEILSKIEQLAKPNGFVSSIEYAGTTTLSKFFRFGKAKKDYDKMIEIKNDFFDRYGFKRQLIFANPPIARATHCKVSTSRQ